ncbi:uncharacterized protein LOC114281629 [Camellia sinensis]|uniref:uncharacterized protein LOC114281629 n=1 Tax=Camellia sinensis TaxID=4442 RepID=UPI001036C7F6|nr:uncharacterized protein LOC114281629 [Camellia sinensis]
MDVDPEAELLPLHIRPFDPAAYRPMIHVLPPDGLRQFRTFDRGVPRELLLREPESHLSYGTSELWVYAYFLRLALVPDEETPLGVPFSHRFNVRYVRRPRESFIFFRRYFDTITAAEITWQPWAPLPAVVQKRYVGAEESARFRLLLEGPVCRAWYLGERFLRQTLGLPEQIVPGPPPIDTRQTERYPPYEMADYTIGWEAESFRGEGNYAEYVQTFIMRPLSSGRRAERERPAAPAAGAGAGEGAGAPWMARARGRNGPRRGRGAS